MVLFRFKGASRHYQNSCCWASHGQGHSWFQCGHPWLPQKFPLLPVFLPSWAEPGEFPHLIPVRQCSTNSELNNSHEHQFINQIHQLPTANVQYKWGYWSTHRSECTAAFISCWNAFCRVSEDETWAEPHPAVRSEPICSTGMWPHLLIPSHAKKPLNLILTWSFFYKNYANLSKWLFNF